MAFNITRLLTAGVLAGSFALGLGGAAHAQDADWAKVIEAAKKEGKVSLYTSTLGAPFHLDIIKAFKAKYGITIELLDVRASELDERIRTEQASQRYNADVVQHGSSSLRLYQRDGKLEPRGNTPNMKNLRDALKSQADADRTPSYILPYGILVNTDLVKPEDEPKSWTDLLNPKWKGKIISDDFRAVGGGFTWFTATDENMGVPDFHQKLSQQGIVFSRDVGNDERRVARGEYPLRIPQLASNYLRMKGLPVKLIFPKEGISYVRFDLGIVKNAPHPNAAKLMIDFYLSEEAQLIYANAGMASVINLDTKKINEDARAMSEAKLLGTTNPDTQEVQLAKAKELYK
jgi:iron(III) transport system substrate-binding protein